MRLSITADDLGLSPGVTRGILEAHRGGVVRSTSLLVTYAGGEEAAVAALAEPELEVGLHLDLVGGMPAAEPALVPSLIDREGRFHGLGTFAWRLFTCRVRSDEVAREVRAQVARARSWGVPALAWDSHRHTHLLAPVGRVVGALAREEGVRWLRRGAPPALPRGARPGVVALASLAAGPFFRGIPGNDWYVDLSSWRPMLDAAAVGLLAAHPGVGEIGAHPGHPDEALRARDALVGRRAEELALLTTPLLRTALGGNAVSWRVPG